MSFVKIHVYRLYINGYIVWIVSNIFLSDERSIEILLKNRYIPVLYQLLLKGTWEQRQEVFVLSNMRGVDIDMLCESVFVTVLSILSISLSFIPHSWMSGYIHIRQLFVHELCCQIIALCQSAWSFCMFSPTHVISSH